MASDPKGSLFSQKLDRVAFTSYFLGAVVPLIALVVVVEQYVLPSLADRNAALGLIALVVSIAVLSLASFLVLRHMSHETLARMDRDNVRLASLLSLSSRLARAQHLHEATTETAARAVEVSNAEATFVLLRTAVDKEPTLAETAGSPQATALYAELESTLAPLVESVMEQGRPAVRAPGDGQPGHAAIVAPLPGEDHALGAVVAVREKGGAFSAEESDGLSTLAGLAAVALSNADLRDSQRNFFSHVTDIIATALDAYLGYNKGHGNRVAQYANRMGRHLELDDATLQRLHFAALLHDIGMLKLERAQQLDPKSCNKHTTLGFRMLTRIRLWQDIAPIVQYHHEWWDGNGYPMGLCEEQIPLESRIIAICDAFDTMTHQESYKPAMSLEDATTEIRDCAGTQFDPRLAEQFAGLLESGVVAIER